MRRMAIGATLGCVLACGGTLGEPGAPSAVGEDAADAEDLLALQVGGALVQSSGTQREEDLGPWMAIDDASASDWCGPLDSGTGQFLVVQRATATFEGFGVTLSDSWSSETPTGVIVSVESGGRWTEVGHLAVPEDALPGAVLRFDVRATGERVRFAFDPPRSARQICVAGVHGYGRSEAPVPTDFSGDWYTGWQFATMHLGQRGAAVEGCYDKEGGEVTGSVEGQVLRLDWRQPESEGRAALRFLGDGKAAGVVETRNPETGAYGGQAFFEAEHRGAATGCAAAPPPTVTTPPKTAVEAQLEREGRALVRGILFDTASDVHRPESQSAIDDLSVMLLRHEDWMVHLEGHTDDRGSDVANLDLSKRRVANVVEALARKGVVAGRMTSEGFGESTPRADNGSALGRAQNRRVEIVKR